MHSPSVGSRNALAILAFAGCISSSEILAHSPVPDKHSDWLKAACAALGIGGLILGDTVARSYRHGSYTRYPSFKETALNTATATFGVLVFTSIISILMPGCNQTAPGGFIAYGARYELAVWYAGAIVCVSLVAGAMSTYLTLSLSGQRRRLKYQRYQRSA